MGRELTPENEQGVSNRIAYDKGRLDSSLQALDVAISSGGIYTSDSEWPNISADALLKIVHAQINDIFGAAGITVDQKLFEVHSLNQLKSRQFWENLTGSVFKLAKLGITYIQCAEPAPLGTIEKMILAHRQHLPKWLVEKTIERMEGKRYKTITTIGNGTLTIGNDGMELYDVFAAYGAMRQLQDGEVTSSNPEMPAVIVGVRKGTSTDVKDAIGRTRISASADNQ